MLVKFGAYVVDQSQIFFKSSFVLGLVNIKPVVPGHVLVITRRIVKRVADLTDKEAADLFCSSKQIGQIIEQKYNARSLTFVVQDGEFSGQSVPHVHMHIIPRYPNDFQPNDLIYDIIERRAKPNAEDNNLRPNGDVAFVSLQKESNNVDNERVSSRSIDEMALEASWLSTFFITGGNT